MEFHGVPRSFMEFHGVLMEFHGMPCSSMELHIIRHVGHLLTIFTGEIRILFP